MKSYSDSDSDLKFSFGSDSPLSNVDVSMLEGGIEGSSDDKLDSLENLSKLLSIQLCI